MLHIDYLSIAMYNNIYYLVRSINNATKPNQKKITKTTKTAIKFRQFQFILLGQTTAIELFCLLANWRIFQRSAISYFIDIRILIYGWNFDVCWEVATIVFWTPIKRRISRVVSSSTTTNWSMSKFYAN